MVNIIYMNTTPTLSPLHDRWKVVEVAAAFQLKIGGYRRMDSEPGIFSPRSHMNTVTDKNVSTSAMVP